MKTSTWITIIGVAVLVLIIGLVSGFVKIKTKEKSEDLSAQVEDLSAQVEDLSAQVEDLSANKGEKLYSHHFDVSLSNIDAGWIPYGLRLDINFNVISNEQRAFQTLSEIDGAGYIASAFGLFHEIETNQIEYNVIVEANLFYANLYNGTLLVSLYSIPDETIAPFIINYLNDYALQDSVSPIN